MSKNIILLSDGTGNSSANLFRTNVWRMFQALDLKDASKQVAYYDNGVGTSSFKLFAILGGVFGFGLMRNVIDIYSFCCRNYHPGDRIYGFGFSRGAFTIRVVAGLIARVGLVKYTGDEHELAEQAHAAYREYRRRFHTGTGVERPLRWLRDLFVTALDRSKVIEVEKIHFLGVWDTVDAYGGPIDEITRAIDYWIWPLSMPDRFMSDKVRRACHALSLEDEREAFRPVLWDERYVSDKDGKLHPMQPPGWKPEIDTTAHSAAIDRMRLSQVWFVGVHSDIGGGYPQDGLSYVTLDWMIDRAIPHGLQLLRPVHQQLQLSADPYDRLNDSRHGLAGYYRYKPRNIHELYNAPPYKLSISRDTKYIASMLTSRNEHQEDLKKQFARGTTEIDLPDPMIHQAVFDRVWTGTDGYAPIMLPANYRLTDKAGDIRARINANSETIARNRESGELIRLDAGGQVRGLDLTPSSQQRAAQIAADPDLMKKFHRVDNGMPRFFRQQDVWNWVWWRRVVYFLTVLASLFLAALPLIEKWKPGLGPASSFELIRPAFSLVALFVPSFLSFWLDAFKNAPGWFVFGAVIVGILLQLGGNAQGRIRDLMRAIWRDPDEPCVEPTDAIYRLRSSGPYRAFFHVLKHWVLPFAFAVLLWAGIFVVLYFVPALVSRVTFGAANALGYICEPKGGTVVAGAATSPSFLTKDVCTSTGLIVKQGATYRVAIKVEAPWIDGYREGKPGGIPTDPRGFGWGKTKILQYLGVPYRRLMWSNWFSTVLRVGSTGFEEHLLSLKEESAADGVIYTATFKPQKDGEVFIFVNDSVIGLPGIYDYFYRSNNAGAATVTLQQQ